MPLFHLRAFNAKLARLRVLGFLDFFNFRNFETGILEPFLVFVDFRSLPRLDFLMWIPLLRRAMLLHYRRL